LITYRKHKGNKAMALVNVNGKLLQQHELLSEKRIKQAISIIKRYEKIAQGDDIIKSFMGTIPWYEREVLDEYFNQHRYDDGVWVVHFKTGNYRSSQNRVVISFHMSNRRAVQKLMLNAGFYPKEIEVFLEKFTGENLIALGKAVESGLFKPDNIKF
jgi:hypothetical protein